MGPSDTCALPGRPHWTRGSRQGIQQAPRVTGQAQVEEERPLPSPLTNRTRMPALSAWCEAGMAASSGTRACSAAAA